MAKVLLAAELGGGYGHVAKLRALAEALRDQGHACFFAVRDLDTAQEYLPPELGPLLQAPLKLAAPRRPRVAQHSYADLLHTCGFDEPEGLAARVRAWIALFQASTCGFLIADHSPTALMAARLLKIPAASFGSGFLLPPLQTPFPAFETRTPSATLAGDEAEVLQVANRALATLGGAPLEQLRGLFAGVRRGLTTYAELDHYVLPRAEPCLGLPPMARGADVEWGSRREPRVFAYLRPFAGLPALLQALKALPAQVLLRLDGAAAEIAAPYTRAGFVIVDRAVHIGRAARSCDAYLNYGAHGTAAEMMLAGKPGLLIPNTRERTMLAYRIHAAGAAVLLPDREDAPHAAALARLLEDSALRQGAETFAAKYAAQDRAAILPQWCAELGIG